MIDLHCHILHGIDDGPVDSEDSVGMAVQAEEDGIALICATPHIRHDHDVRIHELPERVATLNRALEAEGLAVRILTGGEVAETAVGGLDDAELRLVSLGGGGAWILLEPAPGPIGDSLVNAVSHLAERGYGSVIAHPERHAGSDIVERLADLTRQRALVQVTAAFLEAPDASHLLDLARHGVVHLLGSDSHSSRAGRPVRLSAGLERLGEVRRLTPHLGWIAHRAPEAIVRGEPVDVPFRPSVR